MKDCRVFTEECKRDAMPLPKRAATSAAPPATWASTRPCCSKAVQDAKPNPFPGQGNPSDPELARLQREKARL